MLPEHQGWLYTQLHFLLQQAWGWFRINTFYFFICPSHSYSIQGPFSVMCFIYKNMYWLIVVWEKKVQRMNRTYFMLNYGLSCRRLNIIAPCFTVMLIIPTRKGSRMLLLQEIRSNSGPFQINVELEKRTFLLFFVFNPKVLYSAAIS